MTDDRALIQFIKTLAFESAKVINPLFAKPDLKVEWKADDTPVTYADRKAEEVMRNLISSEFPEHGIIGEEFDERKTNPPSTRGSSIRSTGPALSPRDPRNSARSSACSGTASRSGAPSTSPQSENCIWETMTLAGAMTGRSGCAIPPLHLWRTVFS
jgi:hypothetical protein